jgi:hypothetical protein|tara:strand:+ start:1142 stop:1585 length:444 start_codon:yes stop_codon:yes gene_type:complete
MGMLAELMVANAAFKVIKQTLSNGRELMDAGQAVNAYFGAEKDINIKAANSSGTDVLEAFQAKKQLEKQEAELKFLLNKQSLLGYHEFQQFKAQFSRDRKEAEKERLRKKAASAKALQENLGIAIKVASVLLLIMGALFGVTLYLRE